MTRVCVILQVGAAVEVKNQDGVYQEATITKLTDASIYTVGESEESSYPSCLTHTSPLPSPTQVTQTLPGSSSGGCVPCPIF